MSKYRRTYEPMSQINMTPFIDVMLVLLIVFMVTAPLLTVGVDVDLPDTKAGALHEKLEPIVISIDKNQQLFIQQTLTPAVSLTARLKAITQNNLQTRIYLRADKSIKFELLMDIMGRLDKAGFKKIALIGAASGNNVGRSKVKR